MNENPYQPPSTEFQLKAPDDPLRYPAYGCIGFAILGLLITVVSAIGTQVFSVYSPENGSAGSKTVQTELLYVLLCVLGLVVASCMLMRRQRWLVLLSSLLGIALCMPAPLAAVILLRLRRKEVWDSFDKHPVKTQ